MQIGPETAVTFCNASASYTLVSIGEMEADSEKVEEGQFILTATARSEEISTMLLCNAVQCTVSLLNILLCTALHCTAQHSARSIQPRGWSQDMQHTPVFCAEMEKHKSVRAMLMYIFF